MNGYSCKHGVDDTEYCPDCDPEDYGDVTDTERDYGKVGGKRITPECSHGVPLDTDCAYKPQQKEAQYQ